MQDMEFTVEHGQLFMLQTRNGKRTAAAALKIACDLVDEGMISEEQAVLNIDPVTLTLSFTLSLMQRLLRPLRLLQEHLVHLPVPLAVR